MIAYFLNLLKGKFAVIMLILSLTFQADNGFSFHCGVVDGKKWRTNNARITGGFSICQNPYQYSAYYTDNESELSYCRARYYSPYFMRFINRDTYDVSNRYAYCDGDPVNYLDYDGHRRRGAGNRRSFREKRQGLARGPDHSLVSMGTSWIDANKNGDMTCAPEALLKSIGVHPPENITREDAEAMIKERSQLISSGPFTGLRYIEDKDSKYLLNFFWPTTGHLTEYKTPIAMSRFKPQDGIWYLQKASGERHNTKTDKRGYATGGVIGTDGRAQFRLFNPKKARREHRDYFVEMLFTWCC